MCTINKSAHTKKSGNLFNDPRKCNVCRQKTFATQIGKRMLKVQSSGNLKKTKITNRKPTQINLMFATFKPNYESNNKYIVVSVNNKPVRFQFDIALHITLISRTSWKSLGKPCLSATDHIGRSAPGDQIHLTGELICNVTFQTTKFSGVCHLAENSEFNWSRLD